ncbi:MAG: FecCD family ABC transporter permease [Fimbriimonadaceae bacterium]
MSRSWGLVAILVFAVATLAVSPLAGTQWISPTELWFGTNDLEREIFWELRVPRTLASFVAGSGLAIAGMAMQALFRNPLATESTLGVAGGAALGATIYIRLGLAITFFGFSGISLFAFLGAAVAITVIYLLGRTQQGFRTETMLLAGVAMGFFFSSLILYFQTTSSILDSYRLLRWLIGGLSDVDLTGVLRMAPFVAVGAVAAFGLIHELNLLATGEEMATSRGVNTNRVKLIILGFTTLVVGGVVAICGPIGFVGMMVPHLCRRIVGDNHNLLVPASLVFGGAFLALCDTAARILTFPNELPVGAVTALLGGPFFLWILLSKRV